MPTVGVLLYPEALATSLTLPAEICHAADQLARAQGSPAPATEVRVYGVCDENPVRLDSGPALHVDRAVPEEFNDDLLLLPAIWRHPRRVLRRFTPFLDSLVRYVERGGSVCSVGTASTLLAEAGLLSGRAATTHWHDFERFARSYPDVDLKRRHLITQSERLYCVGSVNSIADFMLHMVTQWHGERIARAVEAQFSPEARQSFASAAFLEQSVSAHHDAVVRAAQDAMQEAPALPHTVTSLANDAGISSRSFGRRFRRATGETPGAYLQKLRIRDARALLQKSDLAIAEIAWRCGFSSPSRFAQAFRAATRLTPREYRQAVRGKRFGELGAQDVADHHKTGHHKAT